MRVGVRVGVRSRVRARVGDGVRVKVRVRGAQRRQRLIGGTQELQGDAPG